MKNTLSDLNNHLFESLERIMDDDLSDEELRREITRGQAVTKIAETIIQNGELALRTMQHLNEYGYGSSESGHRAAIPPMLKPKSESYE